MSHPVFLIDLASARPPSSLPAGKWSALAREHSSQLTQCITRIIAHSNVESVTTHLFDSSILTQSGKPVTKPIKDALQDLKHLHDRVAKLDTTGVKHPTAHGVLAGLTDATPEDKFSEFYPEPRSARDVYIFTRAPATRAALSAFICKNELALSSLERGLSDLRYLPNKFKELSKRGDRLIWVNSTPRICQGEGDVDLDVETVFSKWLLSQASDFRFMNLHSYLLDRRIIPAKTMVRSLWDSSVVDDLDSGELVEVLCLQDSQLLRCFSACMSVWDERDGNIRSSQTSLLLSGLVRNYRVEELIKFGAFHTQARVVTPAPTSPGDDREPSNSSVFAGLMVDLARQNMCLIADFFKVGKTDESFSRYQTILQPITPISAVLRKISRTEEAVNYNNSYLPQTYDEWKAWGKLANVKDCDIVDSAVDASAMFFETYLPSLFSTERKESTRTQTAGAAKHQAKKAGLSRQDNMLLSFEDRPALLTANGEEKLATFVKHISTTSKAQKTDHVAKAKLSHRDLILKQLQTQQGSVPPKELQGSPKATKETRLQGQLKSSQCRENSTSPKSANKFLWRRPHIVAPSDDDVQKYIDAHMYEKKDDRSPEAICRNKKKAAGSASRAPNNVVRSESLVHAELSTNTPEDDLHECAVQDGEAQNNARCTKSRETVAHPDVPQYTSESRNCSPEAVKIGGLTERKQPSSMVAKEKNITLSSISMGRKKKSKANQQILPLERHRSFKHSPVKGGEGLGLKYERDHEKPVRDILEAFSECSNKLRKNDSGSIEGIVWECVTHLSSLAERLSFHHERKCDVDRIINLNLKIPRAVSQAVQAVQDRFKNPDSSPNVVFREMWETIISAFEQAMWHLASAWRTATTKPNKHIGRKVYPVSSMLTCTQIMAETAANNWKQPAPFRSVFSKLFSTVFVHLCRNGSGKLIPEIVSLFGVFEQPLPASLRGADSDGKRNETKHDEKETRSYPRIGGAPCQTQPLLVGSSRDPNPVIPPGKGHDHKVPVTTAKKRSRAVKLEPSAIVAHARKSSSKLVLGRSQFAKESEALRNAVKSQTRLPLQSTKLGCKQKSQSKKEKSRLSKVTPDGSTLQDLLAITVRAPVIDDPDADEPEEDSVEQTPPPQRVRNEKNGKAAATSIQDSKNAGTEDYPAGKGNTRSSFEQEEENKCGNRCASAKGKETQGKSVGNDGTAKSDPNKPSSVLSGRTTRHQEKEVTGQKRVGKRPCPDSTDEVTPAKTNQVETKESHKRCRTDKEADRQNVAVSKVAHSETRGQANQALVSKTLKQQTPINALPVASRRLTRSQAKQKSKKRRLEDSPMQNEISPASSGQKKRRRKQLSADPKLPSDFANSGGHESSRNSSSPTTRSKLQAAKKKASLQLRNRSVNRPKRLETVKSTARDMVTDSESPPHGSVHQSRSRATVKPTTRDVIADSETSPMKDGMDVPIAPEIKRSMGEVPIPETPCPKTPCNVLSPETPEASADCAQDNSALHCILNSSLEKRKGQLEGEDFIPETPVAPKASAIIPPNGRHVRRTLTYENE